ncbi:MerR family transcriptional regulator [Thalassomonas actiniarum]|uniref:MerR family transcriptional regulator n=1 Tax=Thalassomonas actiniarum TaxID=485447 RepID=A0AAF0C6Y8_9GAMM|nr:MerR family transcriptional regulator [Thalassomonas actiniarum]WDE02610.1 MerR family transcriptional regulator [Thalassomonas actiniarum]
MFIGEVSKNTGLSIKAIRLYEEKGLIPAPKRRGRYRVYAASDVEVLRLIFEAKRLGVTLARLKNVIVYRQGEVDWQHINHFLKRVKVELEVQLTTIAGNIRQVEKCIASIDSCPVIADDNT